VHRFSLGSSFQTSTESERRMEGDNLGDMGVDDDDFNMDLKEME
jgi:hypothetical protein